jgi:hypothetical protein
VGISCAQNEQQHNERAEHMRKPRLEHFVLPVAISCLIGCGVQSTSPPASATVSGEPAIEYVDEGGALHFATAADFFATVKAVSERSPAARDAWEKRIGFRSLRRTFDEFGAQLERARTEEEQSRLLQEYGDIAENVGDEIRPRIRAEAYAAIANRQGLYYVGGRLHQVTEEAVYSSEDNRVKTIENARLTGNVAEIDGRLSGAAKGVRAMRYLSRQDPAGANGLTAAVTTGCGDFRSTTYTISDRRLVFDMSTYLVVTYNGYYYYQVYAQWRMRGYKKNFFGSWVSYNTTYEYRNIDFQIDAPRFISYNGYQTTFDYVTYTVRVSYGASGGEYADWTVYTSIGDIIVNVTPNAPYFRKVHGEASSRGIGAVWAVIDCGNCGDAVCSYFETASSCRSDCGYCGDGVCYGGENYYTCSDCGYCGDLICNVGYEDVTSCPSDCSGGGGGCLVYPCE